MEEEISLRGEFEKHFLNSDGSYTAVTYSEPVHHKKNGVWEEIDNSLIIQKSNKGSVLKNKDGIMDVTFANGDTEDYLVRIMKDKYSISWDIKAEEVENKAETLNPSNEKDRIKNEKVFSSGKKIYDMKGKKNAKVKEEDLAKYSENDKKLIAKKMKSNVIYEDLFDSSIDIEYTLSPNRVKEDIILNEPTNITSYIMELSVEGLRPELMQDNRIIFYNEEDEEIFVMQAPFMEDSDYAYSTDILVELDKIENKYLLKLTPSREWLMAEERQYPIFLDPTVSPGNTSFNVRDTYIFTRDSAKHNNETTMYVGLRSGKVNRSYIRYTTMPTINGTISSATMNITAVTGTTTYGELRIYQVNTFWDSSTITWDNQPLSLKLLSSESRSGNNISFDVLYAVRNWYTGNVNGSNANYGFTIRYYNEGYNDYNRFYTSENSSNRPLLSIVYTGTGDKYIAYVNNYYDKGYNVRYGETETQSRNSINKYMDMVSYRYRELFGLRVYSNTPTYFRSSADVCKGTVTSSNINTLCTHPGYLHTFRDILIEHFRTAVTGNIKTTNALWSGHRITSYNAAGAYEENRSCSYDTSIYMLNRSYSSFRTEVSSGILMHELNHQYGAPDHYHELRILTDPKSCIHRDICSYCDLINSRPDTCIMYKSEQDIYVSTIICNGCKNDIIKHLDSHHKQ